MDKSLIINRIAERYNLSSKGEIAKFLGISPQTLSNWVARKTVDFDTIFTKCENVDLNWLLTGEGEMIIDRNIQPQVFKVETGGIPLIPIDAMAGYMSDNSRGVLDYECERYIVPMFRGAEFLISVKGSSMQPKYNSGDLVACKKVPIDTFFLWHKVYVIDTEQGVLIKRIEKSDISDHIVLLSDNPDYPPVDIHRQKINSIAIVMGVIRLE